MNPCLCFSPCWFALPVLIVYPTQRCYWSCSITLFCSEFLESQMGIWFLRSSVIRYHRWSKNLTRDDVTCQFVVDLRRAVLVRWGFNLEIAISASAKFEPHKPLISGLVMAYQFVRIRSKCVVHGLSHVRCMVTEYQGSCFGPYAIGCV